MDKEQFKKDIDICISIFNEISVDGDQAILLAKQKVDDDATVKNEVRVLIKATLINSLYSTNIYDIVRMSKHISSLPNIDTRFKNGDITIIEDIRKGHGIKSNRKGKVGEEYNFYSFATKYASLHAPDKFPIYDGLVSDLLYEMNKKFSFCDNNGSNGTKWYYGLRENYAKFREVIDKFCKDFFTEDISGGVQI